MHNAGVVSAIVDENLQSIRDTGQLLKDTVAKAPITEVVDHFTFGFDEAVCLQAAA